MKKLLMSVGVMLCLNANAQWIKKTVDNDFDEPYRICYTESSGINYLKLENVDGEIFFYMQGGYYCDEKPTIDLAFIANGVSKKYTVYAVTSEDSKAIWIINNLLTDTDMLSDFNLCTTLKLRVYDSVCGIETYSFNMGGSQSAISFITNK
jgi:hypothetical protein